jgi:tRNA-Thr(GGU) m(6)t(6)A37 methyltransferase TsaA
VIIEPIGVVRSPYTKKYDAPRQPGVDDRLDEAQIILAPQRNFEQALDDLVGFDRIWIIAWFHEAGPWKPKVLPPRSAVKRGVFATRSPHRPNPIALSVARLVSIRDLTITIAETDLLDGTPVLDIKPYIPYADAFEGSKAGWVDDAMEHRYTVRFMPEAASQLEPLPLLQRHIVRVLSLDPHPHPYRRTEMMPNGEYVLAVQHHRISYVIDTDHVVILRIVAL